MTTFKRLISYGLSVAALLFLGYQLFGFLWWEGFVAIGVLCWVVWSAGYMATHADEFILDIKSWIMKNV